jgi:HJR/Mrr/RecB family endonuclease
MRPQRRKKKRWYELTDSPAYTANFAWREFQKAVRTIVGDKPLRRGLNPEEYLLVKVDRLKRYNDYLAAQLSKQVAVDVKHEPTSEPASDVAKLVVDPEILVVSSLVWEKLIRDLARNPNSIRSISHRAFEELVAHLFERFGYKVELTSQTRDGGRDIIAMKQTEVNARYLIECKHPKTDAKISIAPVRELFAVKVDEGATKGILATTSYLTKDAELFIERHKWELEAHNFDGVMEWVRNYEKLSKQSAGSAASI